MPVNEIESAGDAHERLSKYFGTLQNIGMYAEFAYVLSQPQVFEKGLESVSAAIWKEYRGYESSLNRFTRAIIRYANRTCGFDIRENIVFTGPLSEEDFLSVVKKGALWKDTFAPGHGEFSHTFQWLTAAKILGWSTKTAELFKATDVISKVPLLTRVEGRKMDLRPVPLWAWLVDCFPYNVQQESDPHWDPKNNILSATCRVPNVVNDMIQSHSNDWFLGLYVNHRQVHKIEVAKKRGKDAKVYEQFGDGKGKKTDIQAIKSFQTMSYENKSGELWKAQDDAVDVTSGGGSRTVHRVFSRETQWDRPNFQPMAEVTFHGMKGLVPETVSRISNTF